jgi:hypothetical protein
VAWGQLHHSTTGPDRGETVTNRSVCQLRKICRSHYLTIEATVQLDPGLQGNGCSPPPCGSSPAFPARALSGEVLRTPGFVLGRLPDRHTSSDVCADFALQIPGGRGAASTTKRTIIAYSLRPTGHYTHSLPGANKDKGGDRPPGGAPIRRTDHPHSSCSYTMRRVTARPKSRRGARASLHHSAFRSKMALP